MKLTGIWTDNIKVMSSGVLKVADTDLQIRWGGGGRVLKKFFLALRAQCGLKIRGRSPGPLGPSPGSATEISHSHNRDNMIYFIYICHNGNNAKKW